MARVALIWIALAAAIGVPLAAAAMSPLLEWRNAVYILAGFAGIIALGRNLGVDYSLTHSCYDPDSAGRPCGGCDSCLLRAKGFAEAGIPDPVL